MALSKDRQKGAYSIGPMIVGKLSCPDKKEKKEEFTIFKLSITAFT
jgi:hypothetical protein